ncbi:hypothetical protein JCM12294_29380 [Desulfocicer niacini]
MVNDVILEFSASFIQPSKYFTLFGELFPKSGEGSLESVKRGMKDAGDFGAKINGDHLVSFILNSLLFFSCWSKLQKNGGKGL